jgi:two-component sensor histidine kinase
MMRSDTSNIGSTGRSEGVTHATAMPERQERSDLHAQAIGLNELSKLLATEPSMALRAIPEIARALCHAGSAGVSLLCSNGSGEACVRWEIVSGALSPYEGRNLPRNGTWCAYCLDARAPVLISCPTHSFSSAMQTDPPIFENLIIPLREAMGDDAFGTLWLARHDPASHFSADDVRIAGQLAHQLVLAMKLGEHARHREQAVNLLRSHQLAESNLMARALQLERGKRRQARAAERNARRALAISEAMLAEANHRTMNTLQTALALLSLQARTSTSLEVRAAILEGHARLHPLAVLHSLLGRSAAASQQVEMQPLLQSICDAHQQSYGTLHSGVTLTLTSEPVSLIARDALQISMLANEAITNAYKYAFPHEAAGEIAVQLRTQHESLVLRVADTGAGMDLAAPERGIGINLMRTFATQLQGVFELTSAEGAGTQIVLTLDRSPPAALASAGGSGQSINVRRRTDRDSRQGDHPSFNRASR